MSDTNAQEPTMEEILSSIRRIISEEDAPAAAAPAAAPEPEAANEPIEAAPPPAPEPAVVAFDEGDDDDVLDLTEPAPPEFGPEPVAAVHEEPAEMMGDLDVFQRPDPAPKPAPRPAPAPAPATAMHEDEGLISPPAADLAASAFGQLSRTLAMPAEHRTLEDVVRELLRPMLKDWLDRNLSGIVETAVQAEVERISRSRRF